MVKKKCTHDLLLIKESTRGEYILTTIKIVECNRCGKKVLMDNIEPYIRKLMNKK